MPQDSTRPPARSARARTRAGLGFVLIILLVIGGAWYLTQRRATRRAELATMTPADRGRALLEDKGCTACHQAGNALRAPVLGGALGQTRPLADGSSIVVDAAYLRESILDPQAKIVRGYQGIMPSYAGRLDAAELEDLVEACK